MTEPGYVPRRATPAELLGEVGAVLADLPRFVTSPLYRRWHLRWGATDGEVAAAMPGDALLEEAPYRCTRAVWIAAPPAAVWPWLVQVGCLRAGFYSDDLLDNLGRPSADRIVPELQTLRAGQWVPMSPTPAPATAFRVCAFETGRWLLWTRPDSTWAWVLRPAGGGTRLVTRLRTRYDWSRPGSALAGAALMEFGDFAMMRRMLLGIRARAEGGCVVASPAAVPVPLAPQVPLLV